MRAIRECRYKNGESRLVNLETCFWHIERRDPACKECEVYKQYESVVSVASEKKDPALDRS